MGQIDISSSNLKKYEAIIVDMDGTLYYMWPVKLRMFIEMLIHPWHIRDYCLIRKYRKMHERNHTTQECYVLLPDGADRIICHWMFKRPLRHMSKYRDHTLISILKKARRKGTKIIVYSDYPVCGKLKAVSLEPDFSVSSDDIGCMKPDAEGIVAFLKEIEVDPQKCLVIGDRMNKDGLLAISLSCDYIMLNASKYKRKKLYKEMKEI